MTTVSFFCKACGVDQDLNARLITNSYAQTFQANCQDCGKKLIRYITDKNKDPYFYESVKLKKQRHEMKRDLIQPGQEGFQMLYKKEYDKIQEAAEKHEKKMRDKRRARDAFLKANSANIVDKNMARKIIELEDKIEYGGRN